MKKLLLLLTFVIHLNCNSQIVATNTLICDGQSTTLSAPGNQLLTTLTGGNNHRGNMFNIIALNTITINSFDAHPMANTSISIYYKANSYVGFENTAASWTLVGTAAVVAQPFGIATPVPIAVNVTIPAGQTYAFYVTSTNTAVSLNYTNGTTVGNVYSADANLQFIEGIGIEYPFSGSPFSPRVWNGKINYSTALTTYTWSTGANTPSITVSPSVTTNYSVAVNTPSNVSSISVSVNPSPTVTVNSGAICSGNNFTITPNGASTYTFSGGNAIVTPTTNSSYTVTGSNASGCTNSAVSNVTVNATPTISVNNGTICSGGSFTIAPGGASTYTISGGNTIVAPTTNTSYNVTGTSAAGCVGSNTAVSSVSVNALPTVGASSNQSLICVGQTATLSATGATTYSWLPSGSGSSITVTPTVSTTYTVNGTDANGCSSSTTVTQGIVFCTGISSNQLLSSDIKLYPNPSNGLFNLELNSSAQVSITTILGQVILDEKMESGTHTFNLQDQIKGLYFVKITQNNTQATIKIIVE
ncbi:MAG: T9SS type A sorting domain-containing protein [Bacteroidetes bacterium]|nr:T9SS type A sorting domain-containing protein [Bacteroidota bacterium]